MKRPAEKYGDDSVGARVRGKLVYLCMALPALASLPPTIYDIVRSCPKYLRTRWLMIVDTLQ